MSHRTTCAIVALHTTIGVSLAYGTTAPGAMPLLDTVRETVSRHFELLPYYRPGEVLSRSDVEPLFVQLRQMGWTVRDRRSILRRVPADRDFLVLALRTPAGREFMRKVAGSPHVYDRLDRLSWRPRGREAVQELIRRPDAAEAVKALAGGADGKTAAKTTFQGVELGADFRKPTERIYTVEMLLAQLETSYQQSLKHAAATEK